MVNFQSATYQKGCWTCKDRKIKCDRAAPSCQKCVRGNRDCEGYGPRLSWPRANDKKRAITGPSPARWRVPSHSEDHLYVHTVFKDMQVHRDLSLRKAVHCLEIRQQSPRLLRQPQQQIKHADLVYYFHDAGHFALATFNQTTNLIRDLLMSMTLAYDTLPGQGLFCALLAFSSLRRSGLHQETMKFKVAALHALSASAKEAAKGWVEAVQHVATLMVLCAFEILLPTESSTEWLWYIRGAMRIVQEAHLESKLGNIRIGSLLEWVYYHHTLSRFTLKNWRHKSTMDVSRHPDSSFRSFPYSYPDRANPLPTASCNNHTLAILNLLAEICDTLLDPHDPRSREDKYQERLKEYEVKINSLATSPPTQNSQAPNKSELPISVQLYQTATLVYLVRASQDPDKPTTNLDSVVAGAFAGPIKAQFCDHLFPLFILACEAHTDEQRTDILNLLNRTEKVEHVRSLLNLKAQIQSFWVQRDLHADSDLMVDYLGLMKTVVSSDTTLPSYV
ncbi:fungal-specific transcription factor domain-containing protein [Xylariaceae sp. FL1019]|nr:fungal-specific transcription factor domain-containing protein [Xylariaceae sp. FL1019]